MIKFLVTTSTVAIVSIAIFFVPFPESTKMVIVITSSSALIVFILIERYLSNKLLLKQVQSNSHKYNISIFESVRRVWPKGHHRNIIELIPIHKISREIHVCCNNDQSFRITNIVQRKGLLSFDFSSILFDARNNSILRWGKTKMNSVNFPEFITDPSKNNTYILDGNSVVIDSTLFQVKNRKLNREFYIDNNLVAQTISPYNSPRAYCINFSKSVSYDQMIILICLSQVWP
jgi:hypothetical protein